MTHVLTEAKDALNTAYSRNIRPAMIVSQVEKVVQDKPLGSSWGTTDPHWIMTSPTKLIQNLAAGYKKWWSGYTDIHNCAKAAASHNKCQAASDSGTCTVW